jgi:predicted PurR-regulated permease PerM
MKDPERGGNLLLLVITAIAVAAALYVMRGIVVPFVLAGFLAILARPIIDLVRRAGGPTWLGLIVVIIISAGAAFGISSIVALGVESATDKSALYAEKAQRLLANVENTVSTWPGGSEIIARIQGGITPEFGLGIASTILGSTVGILGDGVVVLLFLVFMVLNSDEFPRKLAAALASARTGHMMNVFEAVNHKALRYLRVKTLFNLLNAAIIFTVLMVFGVDFAPVIALLAFFFNYLPNIGSFITTVLPGAISLVQFESVGHALLIVAILVVLQNIVGNVLEPRAMGESLDLSPVAVLLALLFWGWMWGIVGMILSVPITAILKVVMEQFQETRPLAILMGNRAPAPSEPEAA